MAISASDVKALRDQTGAGMIDCKKALEEANGDFEKAVEILRKKGAAVAAKRADREAKEGIIASYIFEDKKKAIIVETNCETDFVARSDDFKAFSEYVINKLKSKEYSSVEEFTSEPENAEKLNDLLAKCGEKISVTRFEYVKAENGYVTTYIHTGSRLGVIVAFDNVANVDQDLEVMAKDIAMQAAAMNPISVSREEVPQEVIDKEIEIYKELLRKEGKPENMLDKIAQGKLNKYFQENCLLEQTFVKDNTKNVKQLIDEYNKVHNSDVKLVKFVRYDLKDAKK
ncbi:MAG TPA: translation elongation factor Ts [Ignavibacteriales bacterium]|nr:translation elongation factor Ts [Ignavibacteriales bacterium]HOL81847.1 translation elongation factor Ts [Ignavibacteriales bacterium]HOM65052.1 translation elongation factor Ts [Ignavibacteriales bacterium]HPD67216.1 translation elongation factor Ts [Ignavibacteriales bacterium]HPP34016.1 translation elongation factor Ts [Ignavibacteriales bacterium]